MTVKELIEELKKTPQDAIVMDWFCPVKDICVCKEGEATDKFVYIFF